jgi:hypothetical protein
VWRLSKRAPRARAGVRGWAGVCTEGPRAERRRWRWLSRNSASANLERANAGAREACATACAGASSAGRWRARGGERELVERDVAARAGASSTQRAGVQALGGRRAGSASSAGTRVRAREWRDKAEAMPVQQMRKKRSSSTRWLRRKQRRRFDNSWSANSMASRVSFQGLTTSSAQHGAAEATDSDAATSMAWRIERVAAE